MTEQDQPDKKPWIYERIWRGPKSQKVKFKGSHFRGRDFVAIPYEAGDEAHPYVEVCVPRAPQDGDMMVHCPKGFWDIYVISAEEFARDFEVPREWTDAISPARLSAIVDRVVAAVNPRYTRTPFEALECTIKRTLEAIDNDIPGDLVECGTWKGGCSFAMLLAQRYAYGEIRRRVWMYDSFEGMSPPSPCDEADYWWSGAVNLPKDVPDENFCICPVELAHGAAAELGLTDSVIITKGWFADTLPKVRPPAIAVLRIDCDWYEPIKCVLGNLAPLVSAGGAIILDDYHAWAGCKIALDEYLEQNGLSWPLNEIENRNGAWLVCR